MRYSNPIENLNVLVMVKGGVDRNERLLDVEWMRRLRDAAQNVVQAEGKTATEDNNPLLDAIAELKEILKEVVQR